MKKLMWLFVLAFPMAAQDWVGRISNAEAFGKGLDAWMSAQSDPNSGPAMLMARFRECVTNQSRAGYITR